MDDSTRQLVRRRAGDRCEYCRIPQEADVFFAFHIEHIVAQQHQGSDDPTNLALACSRCNAYKGPNLSGIDAETGNVVRLFHPRQDAWRDHFVVRAGIINGITPTGRATVRLLNINAPHRVELREAWLDEGGDIL